MTTHFIQGRGKRNTKGYSEDGKVKEAKILRNPKKKKKSVLVHDSSSKKSGLIYGYTYASILYSNHNLLKHQQSYVR